MKRASYKDAAFTSPCTKYQHPPWNTSILGALKVSKIILGCMSYGEKDWAQWVLEQPEALEILHYAYQRGINTWDTADVYSYGRSEEIVGKALKSTTFLASV